MDFPSKLIIDCKLCFIKIVVSAHSSLHHRWIRKLLSVVCLPLFTQLDNFVPVMSVLAVYGYNGDQTNGLQMYS